MGVLKPFIASTTVDGWIALLIFLGVLVLTYWATFRIIAHAGYSPFWIVLPLAPLVLTVLCYVILWNDLHEIAFGTSFGFEGIGNVSLYWHLDQLSIFLNWVFYLVFAFSRWPVSGGTATRDPQAPPPPRPVAASQAGPASAPPARRAPVGVARYASPPSTTPDAEPAAIASAPAARKGGKYCGWCAESLPGNRALFHDCGPKDRPETFCKSCGTALPTGSTQCASCDSA
jgi:hypothetical protein